MKQFLTLLLALALAISCAACGGKEGPSSPKKPVSGGGPVGESRPESTPSPAEPSQPAEIPQAEDDLVREIIFLYGAYEDTLNGPATLTAKKKSLFLRQEGWGPGELGPGDYLYWVDTLPMTQEEWNALEAAQHHAEGRQGQSPFGYRFFPPELVEEKVLAHFEVTADALQADPEYYDGDIPGYFLPNGGGMGARAVLSYRYSQEGDTLTIPVTLDYPDGSQPTVTHTLTVRLEPDGGWKYLACQVQQSS